MEPPLRDFKTEAARLDRLFAAFSNRRFPKLGLRVDGLIEWDSVLAGYASRRATWKGVLSSASFPILPQDLEDGVRHAAASAGQDPGVRELRAYFAAMKRLEAQILRVIQAEDQAPS